LNHRKRFWTVYRQALMKLNPNPGPGSYGFGVPPDVVMEPQLSDRLLGNGDSLLDAAAALLHSAK